MDDIAQQLDQVRREMAHLLSTYPGSGTDRKTEILNRCEALGGEVQELVGVLKLSIRKVLLGAHRIENAEPQELGHLDQIARYGLRVAHCAGEEVSAAVRLIRQLRKEECLPEP
jgi:hypothetical protein